MEANFLLEKNNYLRIKAIQVEMDPKVQVYQRIINFLSLNYLLTELYINRFKLKRKLVIIQRSNGH